MNPIFIHGLWRSGSTYLWSRFRELDEVCAYYEPFNEALGAATRDELLALKAESWSSGHPSLQAPYYAEYLPLIGERGIPGFQPSFILDQYFEDRAEALEDAERYVAGLVEFARGEDRIPVLGCCRTLGRAPWLRRAFGGTHIVLLRNPRQQWNSGQLQKTRHGNAYFEIMPFQILGKAAWEPARRMAELFGILRYDAPGSFFQEFDRYFAIYGGAGAERSYAVFYTVLKLSLERALSSADIIIDIERLSTDAAYRAGREQRVYAETGLRLSFADASVAQHDLPTDRVDFAHIERSVDTMLAIP